MGETSALCGNERNAVWGNVNGSGSRAVQTLEEQQDQTARLVADLRLTVTRYRDDSRLTRLVTELRAASPWFVELWESAADHALAEQSRHKVIDHPLVGSMALDCDTLVVAGDDLRVMVYTAKPTTADAERLDLALGTQALID